MIYLFCGDDTKNKHKGYRDFIKSVPKSTETFFVGKNDFDPMSVESLYSGAGLFFAKCLVVFTNIFEKETTLDFILEKLDFLIQSSSTFVFLEGKLPKSTLDAFRKAKANISIFL